MTDQEASTPPADGDVAVFPTERPDPYDIQPGYLDIQKESAVQVTRCPAGIDASVLTRYEDVREVLSNDSRFISKLGPTAHFDAMGLQGMHQPPPPGDLIRIDGPPHTALRRMLANGAGPRSVGALEPAVQEIVDTLLEEMDAKDGPKDLMRDFAMSISSMSVSLLVGVPESERRQVQQYVLTAEARTSTDEERMGAFGALAGYLVELAGKKRANPGDDLLSKFVAANDASETPLPDDQLAPLFLGIYFAGHITTAGQICMSYMLLKEKHPEQLELLKAKPELINAACEELLRYVGIVHVGVTRCPVEKTEISGTEVGPDDMLVALISAANRDPNAFPDPNSLDIARERSSVPHLSFGIGTHQCLGQHLARLELKLALQTLTARVPSLRFVTTAPERDWNFHDYIYGVQELLVEWDELLPRA